jgi:hypothetical protein
VTNPANLFSGCSLLTSIPALLFSALSSSGNTFTSCPNLSKIQVIGLSVSFSVANCKLSAAALDEIYTNLPTVTDQTITVTGNYGTATHTPSIATAKGWTVTA